MKRWKEFMEEDFRLKALLVDAAEDRVKWKKLIRNSNPT